MSTPKKIAVFVSGGGTNLQALIDAQESGILHSGEIVLVLASNPTAYALERAKNHGIATAVAWKKELGSQEAFEAVIEKELADHGIDLIVLAGGHVPTQNLFFQKIGLAKLLKNYQGVILGMSAGSMNCARRVYAQPEEPGESRADFRRFYPGLGLSEINILPHYQQVYDRMLDGKRLYEDVTYPDSMGNSFLSLVDGSYILEEKGETTLYGEAYALTDGKFFQISHVDEIVPLG